MTYCRGCGRQIDPTVCKCIYCGFLNTIYSTGPAAGVFATILAALCMINWVNPWTPSMVIGLWMFSIGAMVFAFISLQNKRAVFCSWASVAVAGITVLALLGS